MVLVMVLLGTCYLLLLFPQSALGQLLLLDALFEVPLENQHLGACNWLEFYDKYCVSRAGRRGLFACWSSSLCFWSCVPNTCIVSVVDNVSRCEGMFRVGVDAHQTSFVLLFFAEYLHQQVMFSLGFFHLTHKRCILFVHQIMCSRF